MTKVSVVFPIRFSAGTHAVQTTTGEISLQGVFVRCLASPPVGTRVSLRLYLPRSRPMEATGVVRETSVDKGRGFWADFVDLGADERERVARLVRHGQPSLDATAASPTGADQPPSAARKPQAAEPAESPFGGGGHRVFPRYASRFRIRYAPMENLDVGHSANVSASGVFMRTLEPPLLGTVLLLLLDLPGGPPIEVKGVVAHRVTKEDAQAQNTYAGAGIQFIDASDTFRENLDRAIDLILKGVK